MSAASASPLDRHDAPTAQRGRGKAITAFIIGILAVVGALLPIAGWILGIVAVVLGTTARSAARGTAPWQATAGLWLGVLALVLATANAVAGVIMAT